MDKRDSMSTCTGNVFTSTNDRICAPISERKTVSHPTRPTVIDVFAGVGGMSLGAARAGFSIALAIEKDPHIARAHKLNFPDARHLEDDVSKHDGKSLLEKAQLASGTLTGLIGGPPCQGFSSIGRRNKKDPRNDLFAHFFKLVSKTRPKFFLAENVPGILRKEYDGQRRHALGLAKGYKLLPPFRIKASDCGAPTTRERVFFVGYDPECCPELTLEDFIIPVGIPQITVGTALKGLPIRVKPTWLLEKQGWRKIRRESSSYYWDRIYGIIPRGLGEATALHYFELESLVSGCLGTRHAPEVAIRYGMLENGKMDRTTKSVRLCKDGFCPTLRAGTGSDRGSYQAVRPIHPTEPRVITPREAARLQGFPDWFQFAPSKWHSFRMIGNSVSPFVSEFILSAIACKLANKSKRLLAA